MGAGARFVHIVHNRTFSYEYDTKDAQRSVIARPGASDVPIGAAGRLPFRHLRWTWRSYAREGSVYGTREQSGTGTTVAERAREVL